MIEKILLGLVGGLIIGMALMVIYLIRIEKMMKGYNDREQQILKNVEAWLEKKDEERRPDRTKRQSSI